MKIAIIGTGISGLSAAFLLNRDHEITVFEKNAYLGGHSRTIDVVTGAVSNSVDTGFIVFNHRNYPNLTALFQYLGVATHKSDMSFGASIADGYLEYGSKGMFAQKSNLFRPQFYGMIFDILKFNRKAEYLVQEGMTLATLLDHMNMGDWFRRYYIQAMGAAIWSCSVDTILKFPAETFIRFFSNHGLLTVNDHPQWYTVTGGSRAYVQKLAESFSSKIKLNTNILSIRRQPDHVVLTESGGQQHIFDHVVIAGHADDALSMLTDQTAIERDILGAFSFQKNDIVVHGDKTFMPKNRSAWASWIYLSEGKRDENQTVSLTYWMNSLQGIAHEYPLFVTLNPGRAPRSDMVYDRHTFKHPIFTRAAIDAQSRIKEIQGVNRTHFCGAWQRYGFHEDGLQSAIAVAQDLGAKVPWK